MLETDTASMREKLMRKTRIDKEFWPPRDAWSYIKLTRHVEWTEEFNLAWYLLNRHVKEGRGQNIATIFEDKKLTYAELSKITNKLGNSLRKLGIKSGDRVSIRIGNRPEFLISDLAIQKIGAIPVPLFLLLKASSIEYIGNDAQIKAVIVDADWLEEVEKTEIDSLEHIIVLKGTKAHKDKGYLIFEELMEEGEEEIEINSIYYHDVAMIHYTSGTTGPPKGCIKTPATLLGHVAGSIDRAKIVESDVICGIPPFAFAFGHATLLFALYAGAAYLFIKKYTTEEFLGQVEKHGATVLGGVPTAYRMMLEFMPNYDLSRVRLLIAGGETFTQQLESDINKVLPQAGIFNCYGYTEMWNFIGTIPKVQPATSLGIPYDEYEARILDKETGKELPTGKVGIISVRGAGATFYWRIPEKQKQVVKDGWFCTDDLAYKDKAGLIWFTARDVDIIKSSGYLIAPYEIESVIGKHPGVETAGCIGTPDPVKGELIKAYIKVKSGHEPTEELIEDLKKFAEEGLERYKIPKVWEFIDEIPTTLSGKTLRRELKEIDSKQS